ncbi:hypothetical protein AB6A40_011471, partial [Gnathostoma spinigerum]
GLMIIGSEHTLGGLRYPAEMHLVHKGVDNPEKFAVVGVFLIVGNDGKALKVEENVLSKITEPSNKSHISQLKMQDKLPTNTKSFWRYNGSLTTPPCTECVTWTLFTEPISILPQQLALLRKICDKPNHILEKNFRPVQKLNEREVLHICTK